SHFVTHFFVFTEIRNEKINGHKLIVYSYFIHSIATNIINEIIKISLAETTLSGNMNMKSQKSKGNLAFDAMSHNS
ncbi:MAG: hypothetical protein LBE13_22595, partial [Bacteroidales bacterium]|nr:hypothetical protein [Bacteroidales bacterium]